MANNKDENQIFKASLCIISILCELWSNSRHKAFQWAQNDNGLTGSKDMI